MISIFHMHCIAALSMKVVYRQNITMAVGDTLFILPCYTTSHVDPVWQYRKSEMAEPTSIQSGRFSDIGNSTYNRKLSNTQLNDSGWYECVEDGGKGPRHVTVINVTG